MRRIIVKWGKLRIELPEEMFIFLLIKLASSLLHHNV